MVHSKLLNKYVRVKKNLLKHGEMSNIAHRCGMCVLTKVSLSISSCTVIAVFTLLFEMVKKSVLWENVFFWDKFSYWRSTVYHKTVFFNLIFLKHIMVSTYWCGYQAFQCHYLSDALVIKFNQYSLCYMPILFRLTTDYT